MLNRYTKSERGDIRFRAKTRHASSVLPKHYSDQKSILFRPLLPAPSSCYLTILVSFVLIFVIIVELEKRLPPPLFIKDEPANPGRFIAERAKNHVLNLTSLGPRPTGSFENEVLAVNFLSKEINAIISKAKRVHRISVDIQKTSGSFPLSFLDGMTNVYRNVQNVIVKIGSLEEESGHSLLINCHFDTVTDSPGGSDDGASCAVMLEMLRVISTSDRQLLHNIVFLFNGAEENMMQASHGFITQHKWAKEVRAFINLEACGAGGREILFQAGPEHPWLMQAYAETVPYPLASSLAQEIFQSGIIPGDTDYRIFRDFGHISGLDFAWSSNGYVYHTRLDNAAQIPLGTLQRTGDNILSLAIKLATSDELADTSPTYKSGNMVFFDIIGAVIVYWSEFVGDILNISILCLSFYTLRWNINKSSEEVARHLYVRQLVLCTGVILCSLFLSLLTSGVTAFSLAMLNRSMSWYSRPAWIFFLYVVPSLLIPVFVVLIAARKQRLVIKSPWMLFRLYYDANQILYTVMLLSCVVCRFRSGFIPAMWVFFSCIGSILRERIFHRLKDWRLLALNVGCLVLPYIECAYIVNGALQLIVPIMGRSGSGNHAEVVLGMVSSAMFTLLLIFLVPGILLVQNAKRVVSFLSAMVLVAILMLVLTPLGFPYSGDPLSPAPQRYVVLHVDRTFHGLNGEIEEQSSGFWVVNLDVNSPRSVISLVPEMSRAQLIEEDCKHKLYCGLPYMIPVFTLMWQTHWISGPSPIISIPTELSLLHSESRPQSITRLTFQAVGPDHMSVVISPRDGIELAGWSLVPSKPLAGPKWNGRNTYFVYYSCASDPEPWKFWVDFQVPAEHRGSLVDVAISGHFLHGAHQTSVRLSRFLAQFPPWTATTGWTSSFKSYIF